jgi:hypothetical protein
MKKVFLTTAIVGLSMAMPAAAATVTGWNTDNVNVDDRENAINAEGECSDTAGGVCLAFGEVGTSEVYDSVLNPDGSIPGGATSSATIAFTSDEAFTPGIEVDNTPYTTGGPLTAQRDLDGCILASSSATCTSEFQSGKRIKQKMTAADAPVDLVFNIDPTVVKTDPDTGAAIDHVYQVFGRLINTTGQSLDGFQLELGYGVGSDFIAAAPGAGLSFATASQYVAPSARIASAGTQFPFGLFGSAADNQNFLLDGFFDTERTGLVVPDVTAGDTILASMDSTLFGNYLNIPGDYGEFGPWLNQADVPDGLFWDFDQDVLTDNLLMAWQLEPGADVWELRRIAGETCETIDLVETCTDGQTLAPEDYVVGTLEDIRAALVLSGADAADLGEPGPIEDLSNLNLNYAIALGELSSLFPSFGEDGIASFTLRTTVFATETVAPVPLPAGTPLMLAGLAALGCLRPRKRTQAV